MIEHSEQRPAGTVQRLVAEPGELYPGPADGFQTRGDWPAHWLAGHPGSTLFRCRFTHGGPVQWQISADQRYELFLDGERLGRGPGQGDLGHWPYDTYVGELAPGEHLLVARVWHFAKPRHAQCSVRPAFLCAATGDLHQTLTTGLAAWEQRSDPSYRELCNEPAWGTGAKTHLLVDAQHLAGPTGGGEGWAPCSRIAVATTRQFQRGPRWLLRPSTIPAQEKAVIQAGLVRRGDARLAEPLAGRPLVLQPGERIQAVIDLGSYRCAFPELTASGQGEVVLAWAEALFVEAQGERKADRSAVDALRFSGVADRFTWTGPAGTVRPWWWQAGRFVELTATAGNAPLRLEALHWRETGYPIVAQGAIATSDPPRRRRSAAGTHPAPLRP